jgi:pentatricopeptide repeat protein
MLRRDPQLVIHTFETIRKRYNIMPDTGLFNRMIHAYLTFGMTEKIEGLLKEMETLGIPSDDSTAKLFTFYSTPTSPAFSPTSAGPLSLRTTRFTQPTPTSSASAPASSAFSSPSPSPACSSSSPSKSWNLGDLEEEVPIRGTRGEKGAVDLAKMNIEPFSPSRLGDLWLASGVEVHNRGRGTGGSWGSGGAGNDPWVGRRIAEIRRTNVHASPSTHIGVETDRWAKERDQAQGTKTKRKRQGANKLVKGKKENEAQMGIAMDLDLPSPPPSITSSSTLEVKESIEDK